MKNTFEMFTIVIVIISMGNTLNKNNTFHPTEFKTYQSFGRVHCFKVRIIKIRT